MSLSWGDNTIPATTLRGISWNHSRAGYSDKILVFDDMVDIAEAKALYRD